MLYIDLTNCIALTKERHVSDLENDHTTVYFAQGSQEKRSNSYERSWKQSSEGRLSINKTECAP